MLVLAGCQRHEAAVSLEQPLAPVIATVLAQVEAPAMAEAAEPPADECLKCHSDKDQLIETADPVEEPSNLNPKGLAEGWLRWSHGKKYW